MISGLWRGWSFPLLLGSHSRHGKNRGKGVLGGNVIVRPSLLVDEEGVGMEKLRVGWEAGGIGKGG